MLNQIREIRYCIAGYTPRDQDESERITFADNQRMRLTQHDTSIALWDLGLDAGANTPDGKPPFIADVLNCAEQVSRSLPDDIIVYANVDVAPVIEAGSVIRAAVQKFGCYFSPRVDVQAFTPLRLSDLPRFGTYCGADLFAFSREWWHHNRELIPNLHIGFEGWDFILKVLMLRAGFGAAAFPPVLYHQRHRPRWEENILTHPCQVHNRTVAYAWAEAQGLREYINVNPPYLFGETPATMGAQS